MIRAATPADLPALSELGRQMCIESPHWGRMTYSAERCQDFLKQLIDQEAGFVRVAVHDEEIVGALVAVVEQHWAGEDLIATELALFITARFRGYSYAARLISQFVHWSRACGARLVQVGTSTGVTTDLTVRLYERFGFDNHGISLELDNGPVR